MALTFVLLMALLLRVNALPTLPYRWFGHSTSTNCPAVLNPLVFAGG